jgi:spermidine/putrescine transport system permease protein
MADETVASGAMKPGRPPKSRSGGRFLPVYTGLVIGYLFIPIAVMILFGFNDISGRFNFAWQGFTLRHYRELFTIPELTESLRNSMVIAGVSTVVATVLGTLIGLALTRYRFRGRGGLNFFIFLPMATPEIVLGVSLLTLFVFLGMPRGIPTIMIAHIMFSISYVVVTVRARVANFDLSLEDAARDLGATPWTTFWTVTFPLIFPGILAAALLAFALSIDDYVITSFNAGPVSTFPLWVFGASRIGVPPQVNVMGTLIFMIGVIYAVLSILMGRRAER